MKTLLIFLTFVMVSCNENPTSTNTVQKDIKYKSLIDNYGIILATNHANKVIDFFLYKPHKDYEIKDIKIYLNQSYPELKFYVVGSKIHNALSQNYTYIKSDFNKENKKSNDASFEIYENKIGTDGN